MTVRMSSPSLVRTRNWVSGSEHQHSLAGKGTPGADLAEHAFVAKGDAAALVHLVTPHPVAVAVDLGTLRVGLGPSLIGLQGALASDTPMGPKLVVVTDEAVELGLQLLLGGRGVLAGQVLLQRLVEALHLAAGLGVIGP